MRSTNSIGRWLCVTVCPTIATVLINTYRGDAELFVDSETLYSHEGTTQGDLLAMAFNALATVSLIKACNVSEPTGEVWFVNDATGSGRLTALHTWWDKLMVFGPNFGYYPNGNKTELVVSESLKDAATEVFEGTSVQVTTQGRSTLEQHWVLTPLWSSVCHSRSKNGQQSWSNCQSLPAVTPRWHTVPIAMASRAGGYT